MKESKFKVSDFVKYKHYKGKKVCFVEYDSEEKSWIFEDEFGYWFLQDNFEICERNSIEEETCLIEYCDLCGEWYAFLPDGMSDQLIYFNGKQFLCKECLT